jgi:phytoene synthase
MTLSYCGGIVRKHDPDRFLLSLFAAPDVREGLWALYAFNYEIARTREVVSETQLGLIRLQWWRDALGDFYDGKTPLKNPVLEALCTTIERYALPRDTFETLIYAREFDLEDRLPASLDGMVKYAEFTSVPLMALSLSLVGGSTANNTATAYALTGLLRAVPTHLRQRRCYLPENMIPPVQDLYDGKEIEKLKPAVEAIVQKAESLLAAAASEKAGRLHAKLAQMYLNQIKTTDYDVFSPRLTIPPFARELRLWMTAIMPPPSCL